MPLTLTTNQIKNAAGTEVEFVYLSSDKRSSEYAMIGEPPAYKNRLLISHQEVGSGLTARRRAVVRFTKEAAGQVDALQKMSCSAYVVLDLPTGQLTSTALPADVLAQLMSFIASLGASTTILYDGTGTGAAALLNGQT